MYCLLLLLLIFGNSLQDEAPIVHTKLGTIKGHYKYSYENRLFAAFEGIPYAKPPVGNLRFEAPKNVESWSGILETKILHECAQHLMPHLANENEDCLYLNVYVPRKEVQPNEYLDVMVQIHGGAFMIAGPSSVGPEFIMDRDIIYVTLSYRLGVFGFLSTGDEVVPGNNGMKDQVHALKWVKSNIKHFGGNPNSITITGASAGAAAVHLHYFSPLSQGLFHRGISHGGTALGSSVIHNNPLAIARRLGKSADCNNTSTKDMVECLKIKPAQVLCESTFSTYEFCGFPFAPFSPVIENPSKTAFLTEHPYKLLQKGSMSDLPWLTSIAADEGMVMFFFCKDIEALKTKWYDNLPHILNCYHFVASEDNLKIGEKISKFYWPELSLTDDDMIKVIGDRHFKIPMEISIEMQGKFSKSPIYAYIYSYENDLLLNSYFNITHKGVNHGSDSLLMYDMSFLRNNIMKNGKLSKNDEMMKTILLDIITSFAKDGVPKREGIKWDPANDIYQYALIRHNDITVNYDKDEEFIQFWDSLHCDQWNQVRAEKEEL